MASRSRGVTRAVSTCSKRIATTRGMEFLRSSGSSLKMSKKCWIYSQLGPLTWIRTAAYLAQGLPKLIVLPSAGLDMQHARLEHPVESGRAEALFGAGGVCRLREKLLQVHEAELAGELLRTPVRAERDAAVSEGVAVRAEPASPRENLVGDEEAGRLLHPRDRWRKVVPFQKAEVVRGLHSWLGAADADRLVHSPAPLEEGRHPGWKGCRRHVDVGLGWCGGLATQMLG
jgi:hypothetical protein